METIKKPSKSPTYVLVPHWGDSCVQNCGPLYVPPAAVIREFGAGMKGEHDKVSRRWIFQKDELAFTVYDWKMTSLYDPELPSEDEFWRLTQPEQLIYGSREPATHEDVQDFAEWFVNRCQAEPDRTIGATD